MIWLLYAIGSALFAALTAITAKIGMANVDSNLGTAIRTFVVLIIATGIVFSIKSFQQIPNLSNKTWIFLIVSGFMTGLSWLCYFKALQLGVTTKVVTIDKFSLVFVLFLSSLILKEGKNLKMFIACISITLGTILMIV